MMRALVERYRKAELKKEACAALTAIPPRSGARSEALKGELDKTVCRP
jgi:hypothetical protein